VSPKSGKESLPYPFHPPSNGQSRGYISYSLHSIKVQQSSNEEKNNNYVYYEMIKENESNESRSDKGTDINQPMLHDLKSSDIKNSSHSLASDYSSQNKFNVIGDYGYISPIMPKQNTDINSNASEDNDIQK
jgi:hypothetical protein